MLPDRNEDLLVESLVHDLLTKTQLEFLPENEFVDIVSDFVHNNEKDAIQVYLNNNMVRTKAAVTQVLQSNFDDDDAIKDEILKAKEARCEEYASGHAPRTITHGTAPPKNDFGEGVKPHLKLLDAEVLFLESLFLTLIFPFFRMLMKTLKAIKSTFKTAKRPKLKLRQQRHLPLHLLELSDQPQLHQKRRRQQ